MDDGAWHTSPRIIYSIFLRPDAARPAENGHARVRIYKCVDYVTKVNHSWAIVFSTRARFCCAHLHCFRASAHTHTHMCFVFLPACVRSFTSAVNTSNLRLWPRVLLGTRHNRHVVNNNTDSNTKRRSAKLMEGPLMRCNAVPLPPASN